MTEVQEEKERLAQQASRQRSELDKLQQQLQDKHSYALEAMKSEFDKAREEQERRHAVSITVILKQSVAVTAVQRRLQDKHSYAVEAMSLIKEMRHLVSNTY